MDFSVLLKDLRDVAEKYKGKTTEPQVSTNAYADMFTKILKKALKVTEDYDDQITVLWVALNQLSAIYKDLSSGQARDQLCKFVFGMCARTVLNIQWSNLDEESKSKKNFCVTIESVHEVMSQQGFTKFQVIMDLMASHWTHPTLSMVMSGDDENDEECLEYITSQDPEVLKLRIEIMIKENCEEFALNLCNWSLKHPALENDLKIKEHQIYILYKQGDYEKMQEVCETIVCHDGIKVMSHLAKTGHKQELCIRLAQVFLIQDWVQPNRTCCTQELLKLWIHHQYLADKDEERFLDSIWTVAKVCRDTQQIGVLIDGVRKECGDMFIQLYTELCKYAINIDKGNIEKEQAAGNIEEVKKRKLCMSKTCVRMAFMLKEYDFRISRICGLTAFTLEPTTENLNLVNKLYWTIKNTSAVSRNSKIDIATVYEIERLLGQMRPESLNPDYSWKQLIPVCKKYKQDCADEEKGIKPVKQSDTVTEVYKTHTPTATATMSDVLPLSGSSGQGRKVKHKDFQKDIQVEHLRKLLSQKNVSREEMESILSEQFPRNASDLGDAPALDMKQLDKTIDALKKSIYMETSFRESLEKNLSPLASRQKSSPQSPRQQHGPLSPNSTSITSQSQQQTKLLHQQLTQGKVQQQGSMTGFSQQQMSPPNAHSHHRHISTPLPVAAAYGASPPPAHSSIRRMSSPTANYPASISASVTRHAPAILGQVNKPKRDYSRESSTVVHKPQGSYSNTVTNLLCNKIQNEMHQKQHTFNVLRPPGSAKQECAKIAQEIAELHEKQRAAIAKQRLENARAQGKYDAAKALISARGSPSTSQISNLLSLTFQGNKKKNQAQGSKAPSSNKAAVNQTLLQKTLQDGVNVETSSSVSNASTSKPPNQKQKYFLTTKKDMMQLKPDQFGNVNIGDSQYSIKPLYSIPVSKSELLKTFQSVVKNFSTGGPKPTAQIPTTTAVSSTLKSPVSSTSTSNLYGAPFLQFQDSMSNQLSTSAVSMGNQSVPLPSHEVTLPATVTTSQQQQVQYANQPDFLTGLMVTSQGLLQTSVDNMLEVSPMLQNLDTLATASVSVLGGGAQVSPNPQVMNFQVTQPVHQQQQQAILSPMIDPSQAVYANVQGVQAAVQPEPIMATPLYTVPQPQVVGNPIITTALAGVQQNQVALTVGQPQAIPQIVTVQNTGIQQSVVPIQQQLGTATTVENIGQINLGQIQIPVPQSNLQVQQSGSSLDTVYANVAQATTASPVVHQPPKQQTFMTAPDLSPAVFQQILSSLKQSSVRTSSSNQSTTSSSQSTCQTATVQHSKSPKSQTTLSYKKVTQKSGLKMASKVKEAVKEMVIKRNEPGLQQSVIDATRKIMELRKQYGHQNADNRQSSSGLQRSVSVDSCVPNQTVPMRRKSDSLLQKLMESDDDVKLSSFIDGQPSTVTTANQTIPDLPDLGAQEFQIDAILGLDGDISQASGISDNTLQNGPSPMLIDTNLEMNKLSKTSSGQSTYANANRIGQARESRDTGDSSKVKEPVPLSKCPRCALYFPSKESVFTHIESGQCYYKVSEDSAMSCPHCRKSYKSKRNLQKHQSNHCRVLYGKALKEKEKVAAQLQKMSQARTTQVNREQQLLPIVKCPNCKMFFKNEDRLKVHMEINKCEPIKSLNVPVEQMNDFKCGICGHNFATLNEIKEHVKKGCMKHGSPRMANSTKAYEFKIVYACLWCKFMNNNETITKKHMEMCRPGVLNMRPSVMFRCSMCGEIFEDKEVTLRHVSKQCPKLKVTETQKHIQQMYDQLKSANMLQQAKEPEQSKFKMPEYYKAGNVTIHHEKGTSGGGTNSGRKTPPTASFSGENISLQCNETLDEQTVKTGQSVVTADGITHSVSAKTKPERIPDATDLSVKQTHAGKKTAQTHGPVRAHSATSNAEKLEVLNRVKQITSMKEGSETMVKDMNASQSVTHKEPVDKEANKAFTSEKDIEQKIKNETEKPKTETKVEQVDQKTEKTKYEKISNMSVKESETKAKGSKKSPEVDDKYKVRKEQRISAEKQYWQEFNEIERRKADQKAKETEELKEKLKVEEERMEIRERREKERKKTEEEQKRKENEKDIVENDNKKKLEEEKSRNMNQILGKFDSLNLKQKIKQDIKCLKDEKARSVIEEKSKKIVVIRGTKNDKVTEDNELKGKVKEEGKDQKLKNDVKNIKKETESTKEETRSIREEEQVNVVNRRETEKRRKSESNTLPSRHWGKELRNHRRRVVAKRIMSKRRSPQDIRKLKGLRSKKLIKKRKFFDEIEPLNNSPMQKKPSVAETRDPNKKDVSDSSSYESSIEEVQEDAEEKEENDYTHCRFCDFEKPKSKEKYRVYIISHYINRHKLGYKLVRHKYVCKFCSYTVPSSKTVKIQDHMCKIHKYPLLESIMLGKYDGEVERQSMVKGSPIKSSDHLKLSQIVGVSNSQIKAEKLRRQTRALALRATCAEKLKKIASERKNFIVDIDDLEVDGLNDKFDLVKNEKEMVNVKKDEKQADTLIEMSSENGISVEKEKIDSESDNHPSPRRLAKRLTRNMVRNHNLRRTVRSKSPVATEEMSESDNTIDMQSLGRSRSSSISSSRSAVSSGSKNIQGQQIDTLVKSGRKSTIMTTRSGRQIVKMESESSYEAESSSIDTDDEEAKQEKLQVRRKSTRIRRLSEKMSTLNKEASDDSEESSEEVVTPRITRSRKSTFDSKDTSHDSEPTFEEAITPRVTRSRKSSLENAVINTQSDSVKKASKDGNKVSAKFKEPQDDSASKSKKFVQGRKKNSSGEQDDHYDSDTESNAIETDESDVSSRLRKRSNKVTEHPEGNKNETTELKGTKDQIKEIIGNKEHVNELKGNKEQVKEIKGNKEHVNELKGNQEQVKELKGNKDQVKEIKENKEHVSELKGNKEQVKELKGNKEQVKEIKGNKEHVNELKGNKEQVKELKGNKDQVKEIKGNKEHVSELKGNKEQVKELKGNKDQGKEKKVKDKAVTDTKILMIGPEDDFIGTSVPLKVQNLPINQDVPKEDVLGNERKTVLIDPDHEFQDLKSALLEAPENIDQKKVNVVEKDETGPSDRETRSRKKVDHTKTEKEVFSTSIMDNDDEFEFLKSDATELILEKDSPLNDSMRSSHSVHSESQRSDGTAFDSEFVKFAENNVDIGAPVLETLIMEYEEVTDERESDDLTDEESDDLTDENSKETPMSGLMVIEQKEDEHEVPILPPKTQFNWEFETFAQIEARKIQRKQKTQEKTVDSKNCFISAFQNFARDNFSPPISVKELPTAEVNKTPVVSVQRLSSDVKPKLAKISAFQNFARDNFSPPISVKELPTAEVNKTPVVSVQRLSSDVKPKLAKISAFQNFARDNFSPPISVKELPTAEVNKTPVVSVQRLSSDVKPKLAKIKTEKMALSEKYNLTKCSISIQRLSKEEIELETNKSPKDMNKLKSKGEIHEIVIIEDSDTDYDEVMNKPESNIKREAQKGNLEPVGKVPLKKIKNKMPQDCVLIEDVENEAIINNIVLDAIADIEKVESPENRIDYVTNEGENVVAVDSKLDISIDGENSKPGEEDNVIILVDESSRSTENDENSRSALDEQSKEGSLSVSTTVNDQKTSNELSININEKKNDDESQKSILENSVDEKSPVIQNPVTEVSAETEHKIADTDKDSKTQRTVTELVKDTVVVSTTDNLEKEYEIEGTLVNVSEDSESGIEPNISRESELDKPVIGDSKETEADTTECILSQDMETETTMVTVSTDIVSEKTEENVSKDTVADVSISNEGVETVSSTAKDTENEVEKDIVADVSISNEELETVSSTAKDTEHEVEKSDDLKENEAVDIQSEEQLETVSKNTFDMESVEESNDTENSATADEGGHISEEERKATLSDIDTNVCEDKKHEINITDDMTCVTSEIEEPNGNNRVDSGNTTAVNIDSNLTEITEPDKADANNLSVIENTICAETGESSEIESETNDRNTTQELNNTPNSPNSDIQEIVPFEYAQDQIGLNDELQNAEESDLTTKIDTGILVETVAISQTQPDQFLEELQSKDDEECSTEAIATTPEHPPLVKDDSHTGESETVVESCTNEPSNHTQDEMSNGDVQTVEDTEQPIKELPTETNTTDYEVTLLHSSAGDTNTVELETLEEQDKCEHSSDETSDISSTEPVVHATVETIAIENVKEQIPEEQIPEYLDQEPILNTVNEANSPEESDKCQITSSISQETSEVIRNTPDNQDAGDVVISEAISSESIGITAEASQEDVADLNIMMEAHRVSDESSKLVLTDERKLMTVSESIEVSAELSELILSDVNKMMAVSESIGKSSESGELKVTNENELTAVSEDVASTESTELILTNENEMIAVSESIGKTSESTELKMTNENETIPVSENIGASTESNELILVNENEMMTVSESIGKSSESTELKMTNENEMMAVSENVGASTESSDLILANENKMMTFSEDIGASIESTEVEGSSENMILKEQDNSDTTNQTNEVEKMDENVVMSISLIALQGYDNDSDSDIESIDIETPLNDGDKKESEPVTVPTERLESFDRSIEDIEFQNNTNTSVSTEDKLIKDDVIGIHSIADGATIVSQESIAVANLNKDISVSEAEEYSEEIGDDLGKTSETCQVKDAIQMSEATVEATVEATATVEYQDGVNTSPEIAEEDVPDIKQVDDNMMVVSEVKDNVQIPEGTTVNVDEVQQFICEENEDETSSKMNLSDTIDHTVDNSEPHKEAEKPSEEINVEPEQELVSEINATTECDSQLDTTHAMQTELCMAIDKTESCVEADTGTEQVDQSQSFDALCKKEEIEIDESQTKQVDQSQVSSEDTEAEHVDQSQVSSEDTETEQVDQSQVSSEDTETEQVDQSQVSSEDTETEQVDQSQVSSEDTETEQVDQSQVSSDELSKKEEIEIDESQTKQVEQSHVNSEEFNKKENVEIDEIWTDVSSTSKQDENLIEETTITISEPASLHKNEENKCENSEAENNQDVHEVDSSLTEPSPENQIQQGHALLKVETVEFETTDADFQTKQEIADNDDSTSVTVTELSSRNPNAEIEAVPDNIVTAMSDIGLLTSEGQSELQIGDNLDQVFTTPSTNIPRDQPNIDEEIRIADLKSTSDNKDRNALGTEELDYESDISLLSEGKHEESDLKSTPVTTESENEVPGIQDDGSNVIEKLQTNKDEPYCQVSSTTKLDADDQHSETEAPTVERSIPTIDKEDESTIEDPEIPQSVIESSDSLMPSSSLQMSEIETCTLTYESDSELSLISENECLENDDEKTLEVTSDSQKIEQEVGEVESDVNQDSYRTVSERTEKTVTDTTEENEFDKKTLEKEPVEEENNDGLQVYKGAQTELTSGELAEENAESHVDTEMAALFDDIQTEPPTTIIQEVTESSNTVKVRDITKDHEYAANMYSLGESVTSVNNEGKITEDSGDVQLTASNIETQTTEPESGHDLANRDPVPEMEEPGTDELPSSEWIVMSEYNENDTSQIDTSCVEDQIDETQQNDMSCIEDQVVVDEVQVEIVHAPLKKLQLSDGKEIIQQRNLIDENAELVDKSEDQHFEVNNIENVPKEVSIVKNTPVEETDKALCSISARNEDDLGNKNTAYDSSNESSLQTKDHENLSEKVIEIKVVDTSDNTKENVTEVFEMISQTINEVNQDSANNSEIKRESKTDSNSEEMKEERTINTTKSDNNFEKVIEESTLNAVKRSARIRERKDSKSANSECKTEIETNKHEKIMNKSKVKEVEVSSKGDAFTKSEEVKRSRTESGDRGNVCEDLQSQRKKTKLSLDSSNQQVAQKKPAKPIVGRRIKGVGRIMKGVHERKVSVEKNQRIEQKEDVKRVEEKNKVKSCTSHVLPKNKIEQVLERKVVHKRKVSVEKNQTIEQKDVKRVEEKNKEKSCTSHVLSKNKIEQVIERKVVHKRKVSVEKNQTIEQQDVKRVEEKNNEKSCTSHVLPKNKIEQVIERTLSDVVKAVEEKSETKELKMDVEVTSDNAAKDIPKVQEKESKLAPKTETCDQTAKSESKGTEEENVKALKSKNVAKAIKMDIAKAKQIDRKRSSSDDAISPEVQMENETDEDFKRRVEAVRTARRKSSIKSYESDFNFDDQGKTISKGTVPEPRNETECNLDNFDTASLYSNSSSGSNKLDTKASVYARCARDFGRDEAGLIGKAIPITMLNPVRGVPVTAINTVKSMTVSTSQSINPLSTPSANIQKTTANSVRIITKTNTGQISVSPTSTVSTSHSINPLSTPSANVQKTTANSVRIITKTNTGQISVSPTSTSHSNAISRPIITRRTVSVSSVLSTPVTIVTMTKGKLATLTSSASPVVHTSTPPQKTTVSAMAVKLANTMGSGIVTSAKEDFSKMKYKSAQIPEEKIEAKIKASIEKTKSLKIRDKNVLPVGAARTKDVSITQVGNYSLRQGITKNELSLKSKELEKTKKNQKTMGEPPSIAEVIEPNSEKETDELDHSKVKSLRALHKDDKPFSWETSPHRDLRSKSKTPATEESAIKTVTNEQTNKQSNVKTRTSVNEALTKPKTISNQSSKIIASVKNPNKSEKSEGLNAEDGLKDTIERIRRSRSTSKDNVNVSKPDSDKANSCNDKGNSCNITKSVSGDKSLRNMDNATTTKKEIDLKDVSAGLANKTRRSSRENVSTSKLPGSDSSDKMMSTRSHSSNQDSKDKTTQSETRNISNVSRSRRNSRDTVSDSRTKSESKDKGKDSRSQSSLKDHAKTSHTQVKHTDEEMKTFARTGMNLRRSDESNKQGHKRKSPETQTPSGSKRKVNSSEQSNMRTRNSTDNVGGNKNQKIVQSRHSRQKARHNSAPTSSRSKAQSDAKDEEESDSEFRIDSELFSKSKINIIEEVKRRVQKRRSIRDTGSSNKPDQNLHVTNADMSNIKGKETTADKMENNIEGRYSTGKRKSEMSDGTCDRKSSDLELTNESPERRPKRHKLDGTTNSPDKSDSEGKRLESESDVASSDNEERKRSPVRQVIHRGKVIQIGKGLVREFDIQKTGTLAIGSPSAVSTAVNTPSLVIATVEDFAKERRRSKKRSASFNLKDDSDVNSVKQSASSRDKTSQIRVKKDLHAADKKKGVKSAFNRRSTIDDYISSTLKEIRKDRQMASGKNWTVNQDHKKSFKYQFKKSKH